MALLLLTFPLPLFLLASMVVSPSSSQPNPLYSICSNSAGNFTVNSTYSSNLDGALSALLSSTPSSGFANTTYGSPPDRVEALALCRGDVNASTCSSCLDVATSDAEQNCPYRKTATIYYDNCLLRYSNQRIISTVGTGDRVYMWNANNATPGEAPRFNTSVWAMLGELRQYAVLNATSPPLFAAGEMAVGGEYGKLYGLVQCTRDVAGDGCDQCLRDIISDLPNCCNGKIGGRVLVASCNFRYETYSFFNFSSRLSIPPVTLVSPPPSSSPPPVASPPLTDVKDDAGNNNTTKIVLAISIPLGVLALLSVLVCCIYFNSKKKASADGSFLDISTVDSLLFEIGTIKRATSDFSPLNKLGEGGFGPVYKGTLSDGREIAVKRLSANSSQGLEQLKNEVVLLANLQHRNLVRLLGVCIDGGERSLVYEYVVNRSLDAFLSDPIKKSLLTWEKRYRIIAGIVRGLLYLHEESQLRIVHRDLKASNILLDGNLNPKISDFGLARIFGGDQTQARTNRIVGTYGYMSPEYAMRGQYSIKSDVYSLGILVLEIVTGKRNIDLIFQRSENSTDLLNYVWEHWSRGSPITVVDTSMEGNYSQSEALRCIQIGLLCVQRNPADRPSMPSVALMFSSESTSISSPIEPAFFSEYSKADGFSIDSIYNSDANSVTMVQLPSPNEVSSELGPR